MNAINSMGAWLVRMPGQKKDCLAANDSHARAATKHEKALPKTAMHGDASRPQPELPPWGPGGDIATGAVLAQYVRCGKPSCRCRCASGLPGRLHGPYWYRFFREEGRLRKVYVPRADVDRVRAECEAYRQMQAFLLDNRRRSRESFTAANTSLRLLRRLPVPPHDTPGGDADRREGGKA